MIDFVLKAVGLLAITLAVFFVGNINALLTIKREAPELYTTWAKARNERKGKQ